MKKRKIFNRNRKIFRIISIYCIVITLIIYLIYNIRVNIRKIFLLYITKTFRRRKRTTCKIC